MKNIKNENGRSMIEMLEKVKQPLNAVLRRQAQVFRCCQLAYAPRSNTENQVTEAPLGARQRTCAPAQSGRSMIEMLGVLAIIGVLSVGGIAGYSKAMMRYRINKCIEQITLIAGNVHTFFGPQKSYNGLSNGTLLKKAKLAPDDMWGEYTWLENANDSGTGYGLTSSFGSKVTLYTTKKDDSDASHNRAFEITYHNLPQEACIELATQNWQDAQGYVLRISNENNDINGRKAFLTPVSLDNAVRYCSGGKSGSRVEIYFDVDVNSNYWKAIISKY